jgi:hypothetical protein
VRPECSFLEIDSVATLDVTAVCFGKATADQTERQRMAVNVLGELTVFSR